MPLRAYSERSRITCSADAYSGIVMGGAPDVEPDGDSA
jgi:hypothetical protein